MSERKTIAERFRDFAGYENGDFGLISGLAVYNWLREQQPENSKMFTLEEVNHITRKMFLEICSANFYGEVFDYEKWTENKLKELGK